MSDIVALKKLTLDQSVVRSFEQIMGKKAAGFLSSIISCANGNAQLAKCEPLSVIRSASIAAILDLPLAPGLGFAFIVPYNGVATFQLGWKGYVQLAQRTGQYARMHATPVTEGMIKSRNLLTGDMEIGTPTSNKVVGYCFYFKLLSGFERYHYMSAAECEAHGKRYSQSYAKGFGPWKDNFEAMALKTVVKQSLSKWGVLSIDLQHAYTYDNSQVLDIGTGACIYPDNSEPRVTAESSAAKLEERKEARDFIPGLKPEQTCEEFFATVKTNLPLLEVMISGLVTAGHTKYVDKLNALYKAEFVDKKPAEEKK
jgi:recombination protein RecT